MGTINAGCWQPWRCRAAGIFNMLFLASLEVLHVWNVDILILCKKQYLQNRHPNQISLCKYLVSSEYENYMDLQTRVTGLCAEGLCAIRLGYVEGHLWHSTPDIKAADSQPQNINRIHIQPVCFSIVQRIPGRTSCIFMLFVLYLIIPFNVWIFGFLSWSKYIQCPKFELIGRLNIRHLKPVVLYCCHYSPKAYNSYEPAMKLSRVSPDLQWLSSVTFAKLIGYQKYI